MADDSDFVDKLLDSVNDAARNTRNVLLVFLLAGLYIAILIGATTDEQFLRQSSISLPILNVTLPIVGFYVAAGPIYVILHFNLLLQFYMLSRRIRRFRAANRKTVAKGGLSRWILVFPLPFTEAFAPQDIPTASSDDDGHHGLIGWLLRTMTWLMAIGIPVFLLLWMQTRFLAYQSEAITWLHRSMLVLDMGMIAALWPILADRDSRWRQGIQRAFPVPFKEFIADQARNILARFVAVAAVILAVGVLPVLLLVTAEQWARNAILSPIPFTALAGIAAMLGLSVYTLLRDGRFHPGAIHLAKSAFNATVVLTVLVASLLVGVIPGSRLDQSIPLNLTQSLLDGADKFIRRHLVIRNKLLIAAPPPDATIERYLKDKKTRDQALRDHAEGLDLAGRNLRRAIFVESKLYNAKLQGAELQGANLRFTNLQRANLSNAQLKSAKFLAANLQGENLENLNL